MKPTLLRRTAHVLFILGLSLTCSLSGSAQTNPPGFGGGSPDPLITSFSPGSGAVGSSVRIRGAFLTQLDIYFGTVLVTTRTLNTDSAVVAIVPAGAITAPIRVHPPGSSSVLSSTSTSFTVVPPIVAPLVSSISPGSGPVGARIRIRGRSLSTTSAVRFGSVAASSFAVSGDSLVTAIVPVGAAGSSKISLTLGSNTLSSPMFFPVTPAYAVINSLSSATVRIGDSVRIRGRYFTGFSAVRFNGAKALQTRLASDSEIVAVVPLGSTTGSLSLQGSLNVVSFPITVAAQPQVLSFYPSNGPVGEKVRIRGRGLAAASQVLFGNVAAQNLYHSGDSLLTVVVPVGATTGRLQVNVLGSVYNSAAYYVVVPRPFAEILSFSPTTAARGSQVTLVGRHFSSTRFLRFGSVDSYTFTVQSDSVVTATVPGNAQAGVISLVSLYNTARSSVGLSLLAAPSAGRMGEELESSEPTVFPNPSASEATLRMSRADAAAVYEVAAYSSDGRVVLQNTVSGAQLQEGLRLNALPAGLYTLQVTSGKSVSRVRWVVSK